MRIFPATVSATVFFKEHQQLSINKSRKKWVSVRSGYWDQQNQYFLLNQLKPVSTHTLHTFSHRGNVIPLISSFSVVGFDRGNVDNPHRSNATERGKNTFDLIQFSLRHTRSNEKVLGELITTYFHIHLWVLATHTQTQQHLGWTWLISWFKSVDSGVPTGQMKDEK